MNKVTNIPVTMMGEAGFQLHQMGWNPLPLSKGTKSPCEAGWTLRNKSPWPEDELPHVISRYFENPCGIVVTAKIVALDIDVGEPDVAEHLEALANDILGLSPLKRVGSAPKALFVYRSDGSIASQKPHPVEIFCGSGQFVAFGQHSKTGKPYEWTREATPLSVRSDDSSLPMVGRRDIQAFLKASEPLLKSLRHDRRPAVGGQPFRQKDALELMRQLLILKGVSYQSAVEMVLRQAADGGRRPAVLACVSYGFTIGLSPDRIERVIRYFATPNVAQVMDEGDFLMRLIQNMTPNQKISGAS